MAPSLNRCKIRECEHKGIIAEDAHLVLKDLAAMQKLAEKHLPSHRYEEVEESVSVLLTGYYEIRDDGSKFGIMYEEHYNNLVREG